MLRALKLTSAVELLREKQKDYRNIVLIQVTIIVLGLTLSQFLMEANTTPAGRAATTIFSFFGALYSFLMWDMLRNFTQNKTLLRLLFVILCAVVAIGLLSEFPYYRILPFENRQLILFILHASVFPLEVTVIGFAIRDIFSGDYLTPDKLWGSACIYLMIGICFGSLYDLICIVRPGSLGEMIPLGLPNYGECVTYSLSILGGMDPDYPNAHKLIRNISVLEAVWSNLFVVLIIGKLLGLPRAPK